MADRDLHERRFAAKILQEADVEPTAIKFVADGLGVALLPEQITGLPRMAWSFRPLSPPLRRESTIAWRADNPSKPLHELHSDREGAFALHVVERSQRH